MSLSTRLSILSAKLKAKAPGTATAAAAAVAAATVTVALAFLYLPPAFADGLTEGKAFYAAKDYNKAAKSFELALTKDRRNANLHYYLANCYVAKKDYSEAIAEYQYAADLTKDEKVRDYCNALVSNLQSRHPGGPSSRSSIQDDGSAAAERARAIMQRGQAEANDAYRDANYRLQDVSAEQNNALRPYQGQYRNGDPISTPGERASVSAPYDQQSEEVRRQARIRAETILHRAEEDARKTFAR